MPRGDVLMMRVQNREDRIMEGKKTKMREGKEVNHKSSELLKRPF